MRWIIHGLVVEEDEILISSAPGHVEARARFTNRSDSWKCQHHFQKVGFTKDDRHLLDVFDRELINTHLQTSHVRLSLRRYHYFLECRNVFHHLDIQFAIRIKSYLSLSSFHSRTIDGKYVQAG